MPDTAPQTFFERLARTPTHLRQIAERVGAERAKRRASDGSFSLLEHVWHLADLESEAYGVRIRRLRDEVKPLLADFDGGAIALERRYLERELEAGLSAFATARTENLAALSSLTELEWGRTGRQEGVGTVALADVPRLMAEHDATHDGEIAVLRAEILRDALAETPAKLSLLLREFSAAGLRAPPVESPTEAEALSAIGHAQHLVDIELEGYQVRIRRLRREVAPVLLSLDGLRMAAERRYEDADPEVALEEFAQARALTVARLAEVRPGEWSRAGTFEGYGPVSLLGMVEIIEAHDRAHLTALTALAR